MKKMAILTLTSEAFLEFLGLPDGITLKDVRIVFGKPGEVEILIEGSGWEVPPGMEVAKTRIVSKTFNWGLPDQGESG